jgi:hypothetical protein
LLWNGAGKLQSCEMCSVWKPKSLYNYVDIHVISSVASSVWVRSGKFVVTNEKYFHNEVALMCVQKEGDFSSDLNYSYDKTVWALYSTMVFFISWVPLFSSCTVWDVENI